ncbi:MAG: indolepyruvate oxidoreductase subunit beta [Patescibacteria group bacterium]
MFSNKTFNLILAGYGGQGVLTIAEILAKAAILEGYDVKQAELHGLAQRGGSLECHLRFGKKVNSPLVRRADADLIISLELLEALRVCYYARKNKTIILTNAKIFSPYPLEPEKIKAEKIISDLKKFVKVLKLVKADELIQKVTKDTAMINTLMLGFALAKKFLPLKKESVFQALVERIRPQFLEDNKKIFEIAFEHNS